MSCTELNEADNAEQDPFLSILTGQECPTKNNKTQIISHCRFCAEAKSFFDLLDTSEDINTQKQYLEFFKFLKIDYIDFSILNNLPKTVCEPCHNSLTNAYEFFKQMKNSQDVLNKLYNLKDFKVEVAIKVEPTGVSSIDLFDGLDTSIQPIQANLETINTISNTDLHDLDEKLEDKVIANLETAACILNDVKHQDLETDKDIESDSSSIYSSNASNELDELTLGQLISYNKKRKKKEKPDRSWDSYTWICCHCGIKYQDMLQLRLHSTIDHNICFGFKCVDCKDEFNTFNEFIEHVRLHRSALRLYCQYCNKRFKSADDCVAHAAVHWLGAEQICDRCGAILPGARALRKHKAENKRKKLPKRMYKRKPRVVPAGESWADYDWTCQLCCARFPQAEALREHAMQSHGTCFAMKCADCLRVLSNFRAFVAHVTKHRPLLKRTCEYCGAAAAGHAAAHAQLRPCDGCGRVFASAEERGAHVERWDPVRARGHITAQDKTCGACRKTFNSMALYRAHRRKHHERRDKDYVCHVCGKDFFTGYACRDHIARAHAEKTERCRLCDKAFSTARKLKLHVATHSQLKPFACGACAKAFRTARQLRDHALTHSDVTRFACEHCGKGFKFRENLKVHAKQHTGERPYACERCDKTFVNWANCNKHMIRKHQLSLARTKLTPLGRVAIDRRTGQPALPAAAMLDEATRQWMSDVTRPLRRSSRAH